MLLLALASCSTPKQSAESVFTPDLVVHTVPEGAEVLRNGSVIGHTPIAISVKRNDASIELTLRYGHYFPGKATLDGAAIYQAGGGETWVALKADTLGEATGDIDANDAADVDRDGVGVAKAGRCEEALQFFKRALLLDPKLARAHKDMARCLSKLKRGNEAVTELEQYLLLDPDAPDAEKVQDQITRAKARANQDIDLPYATGSSEGGKR